MIFQQRRPSYNQTRHSVQKTDPAHILKYIDEDDKLVWWEWFTDKRP